MTWSCCFASDTAEVWQAGWLASDSLSEAYGLLKVTFVIVSIWDFLLFSASSSQYEWPRDSRFHTELEWGEVVHLVWPISSLSLISVVQTLAESAAKLGEAGANKVTFQLWVAMSSLFELMSPTGTTEFRLGAAMGYKPCRPEFESILGCFRTGVIMCWRDEITLRHTQALRNHWRLSLIGAPISAAIQDFIPNDKLLVKQLRPDDTC